MYLVGLYIPYVMVDSLCLAVNEDQLYIILAMLCYAVFLYHCIMLPGLSSQLLVSTGFPYRHCEVSSFISV